MKRGKSYCPFAHAEALGLRVEHGALRAPRKGEYRHDERLIVLRRGLDDLQARCTLSHEIQHAIAGDVRSMFGPVNARQECLADRRAAALLVDPAEYAEAEAIHGPHCGAVADELGVTLHMLTVWRERVAPTLDRTQEE